MRTTAIPAAAPHILRRVEDGDEGGRKGGPRGYREAKQEALCLVRSPVQKSMKTLERNFGAPPIPRWPNAPIKAARLGSDCFQKSGCIVGEGENSLTFDS